MARGAIDLYAGAPSIQGANLWKTDYDPLNQLDSGVEDVIGQQAALSGSSIITTFESILRALLGFPQPGSNLVIGSDVFGTLANISTYFGNVETLLGDLNPLDPGFNLTDAATALVNLTLYPLKMLGPMDPTNQLLFPLNIPGLDASKIITGLFAQSQVHNLESDLADLWAQVGGAVAAFLEQWQLALLPVSSVGILQPELLANPHYEQSVSVDGGADWFWDGTIDHDGDGTGSVRVTGNGAAHQLFSDPPVGVAPNQQLTLSHWLQWSGVTGTGVCFKLSVAAYLGATLAATTDLQTISSPAVGSSWVKLSGTYTVPASGVDNIRLLLTVTSNCTAGTIHWDTGSVKKTQLFGQDFTAGLIGDLNNLLTQVGARALLTDFTGLMSTLGLGTGTLAAITSRLANIGSGGLFNSSGLTNMAGFPGIDASKVLSGVLDIITIPTTQLTRTNIFDLGSLLDQITNGLLGGAGYTGAGTANSNTEARGGLDSIFRDILNATHFIQDIRSTGTGTSVSGSSTTVNFGQYPNGAMPSNFTVVYSGTGSSQIGVTSGAAGWRIKNNDGNRNAHVCYNVAPTKTDFQIVRGTLTSPPPGASSGGTPRIAALGRVDNPANPQNYVWARGYCIGILAYRGDIGCTVAGVDTVWASNIPLTWSMDISMVVGVAGNPRRYQVFSGTELVHDLTEPGTASQLGAGFRYWGCRNEIKTGGPNPGPSISSTSVSDNQLPDTIGSFCRQTRLNTAIVGVSGGFAPCPATFFDTLDRKSDDFTVDPTTNGLIVTMEGTYCCNLRYAINDLPDGGKFDPVLYLNGGLVRRGSGAFTESFLGANTPTGVAAGFIVYCEANDLLQPGFAAAGSYGSLLTGAPGGVDTYFEVGLLNRSTA